MFGAGLRTSDTVFDMISGTAAASFRCSAAVQSGYATLPRVQGSLVILAHRFILVGYLCNAIAAWMLFRKPARAGFLWLAIGCTLLLLGGIIQQHR